MGREDGQSPLAGVGLWHLIWLSFRAFFSADCLLARRVFQRSRWRGWMVVAFIWGALALAAAVMLSAGFYLTNRTMPLALALWIEPLLDVAGLVLLLGLLAALARRYLFPPQRWVSVGADGALLVLFALAVLSGLLLEGVRLAGSDWGGIVRWPVGAPLGVALSWLALRPELWGRLHLALYIAHAGLGFCLIAYLPFSRLFHILAAPITTYAARRPPAVAGRGSSRAAALAAGSKSA